MHYAIPSSYMHHSALLIQVKFLDSLMGGFPYLVLWSEKIRIHGLLSRQTVKILNRVGRHSCSGFPHNLIPPFWMWTPPLVICTPLESLLIHICLPRVTPNVHVDARTRRVVQEVAIEEIRITSLVCVQPADCATPQRGSTAIAQLEGGDLHRLQDREKVSKRAKNMTGIGPPPRPGDAFQLRLRATTQVTQATHKLRLPSWHTSGHRLVA